MDANIESRVEEILSKLTLKEKVSLLSGIDGWLTAAIERLGISSLIMTDGPHGVRTDHGSPARMTSSATAFPTGVSIASTWNPELVERVGAALAEETLALGCDVLLGPCVNIVRHPLAGRNFEAYSEDPFVAGKTGTAWVKGLQGKGVGASLKHYACNNQEYERFRGNSVVDERTLREIYLPHFEMVVKEAQPWTVMCAYNRVNGVYASEDYYLLTEILRGEWGFDGAVISDWGANHTTVESIEGGLDLEMPGPAKYYGGLLVDAVNIYQIEEESVNDAVRRMLRLLVKAGRLDGKPRAGSVNTPEHQALARELAEDAITLLKNEESLLPLNPGSLKTVAVIGPNAAELQVSGGGSARVEPPYLVSPMDALRSKLDGTVDVLHARGCGYEEDIDQEQIDEALELAKRADMVLLFAGMPENFETEGRDRPHMRLPGGQDELIRQAALVNRNIVIVLNCGAPVEMPWIDEVKAVVQMYYPGMEGGNAIANILLGEVNPSGKLTVTYPKKLEDTPAYLNYPGKRDVIYGEEIFTGYRYYEKKGVEPLFPFGHGLSYTTFEYCEIQGQEKVKVGESVRIDIEIRNTGDRPGKEVVQLYVRDLESSLPRPVKELKGFQKVSLNPGESTTVSFELNERAFAFYHPDKRTWVVEPGAFEIMIGSSSMDIRGKAMVVIEE